MNFLTLSTASKIAMLAEQGIEALRAYTHLQLSELHARQGALDVSIHFELSARHIAHRLGREADRFGLPTPVAIANSPFLDEAFRFGVEDEHRPSDYYLNLP